MTTIVRRRWHCRMSSNLLGLAAVGIAVVAGCTSEETALQPVDTTAAAITSATAKPAKPPKPATASARSPHSRAGRCGRSRCRPTDGSCSRSTRRTTGSRSSASTAHGAAARGSVPVGLEPVAVAARSDDEVWVVNHLSDSVSVVDVGDGPDRRASCARCSSATSRATSSSPGRGSDARVHHHRAPRPEHPGRSPAHHARRGPRRRLGVRRRRTSARSLGGTPLTIVTLFTDTPRALAVTPDGSRVYAAGFHSGNRTTTHHRARRSTARTAASPPPAHQRRGRAAAARPGSSSSSERRRHWVDERRPALGRPASSSRCPTRTCS